MEVLKNNIVPVAFFIIAGVALAVWLGGESSRPYLG